MANTSPYPPFVLGAQTFDKAVEDFRENASEVKPSEEAPGKKYSKDKIQYSLIPPYALEEVARNLTVNLKKYPNRENWKSVPNARQEYLDALMRHLESYRKGIKFDPDALVPNIHELSAIIVNAMFLLEFDTNPNLIEVKE